MGMYIRPCQNRRRTEQWGSFCSYNVLELNPVILGLSRSIFAKDIEHCHNRKGINGMATDVSINKMVMGHSKPCNEITQKNLVDGRRKRQLSLCPLHCWESEWSLLIQTKMCDLFASRNSYQFEHFASFRPDSEADTVDWFTPRWKETQFNAFPSSLYYPRVLQKVRQHQATTVIRLHYW